MTIIDDTLAIDRERSEFDAPSADRPTDPGRSRRRTVLGVGTALVVTAGLAIAAVQAASPNQEDGDPPASRTDEHVVVGTGPNAVYVGPAATFGGDPVSGETDSSYYGRTGRHLPGIASAMPVEGTWWYGPAPVFGGDPVPGETDDSYFARTGRHLPGRFSTRDESRQELVARGLVPAAGTGDADRPNPASTNTRSSTP